MRVRLRGINSITKRLADGTLRTYWYAWKGGPPLRGEPGTAEFIASYNEAAARKVTPLCGKLLSVLQDYQASEDFRGLADSTRRGYVALITRIEKAFGDFPLSGLPDRRTRGIFRKWRDDLAANSGRRQADYAWSVLARVLSWGLDRGLVTTNPCARGGRLYRGSRAEKIWTEADEAAFLERAPAHLHLPLLLALWTGQRQGDLLRLPWSAYDGKHIRLRQSKTGTSVMILVGAPLKAALDANAFCSLTRLRALDLLDLARDDVGRRNWTFAGSDEGGRRAAAIYTLVATAKLSNVDPQAWHADLLARLPDHPAKRIHELLPWNWRPHSIAPRPLELVLRGSTAGLHRMPTVHHPNH